MTGKELIEIAGQFRIEGKIAHVDSLGEGFISETFKVITEGDAPDYILQRKNKYVFPDVPGMMENIVAVTEHIKSKVADPLRETLTVIPALDGRYYFVDAEGEYWAVCLYIDGTDTYASASTPELAYQGGVGLGRFQTLLSDFDRPLHEVIKGFHNIRWRFVQWDESLKRNAAGLAGGLAEEISWIESRRERMLSFWKLVEDGVIPVRATHNDTKISNFLFDKSTGKVLCAIDLDTVMSSTSLNDVGDALRSYTNTGLEDDVDLDRVSMSMDMFKAYIGGYMSQRKDTLSEVEKKYLAFSGLYITFEQVLRFLMDYIDGSVYYKVKYPEHNLVRTRAQYKLLRSMEEQYDLMCEYVESL